MIPIDNSSRKNSKSQWYK